MACDVKAKDLTVEALKVYHFCISDKSLESFQTTRSTDFPKNCTNYGNIHRKNYMSLWTEAVDSHIRKMLFRDWEDLISNEIVHLFT